MTLAEIFRKGRSTSLNDIVLDLQRNMSEENQAPDEIIIQISDYNFNVNVSITSEKNVLHRRFTFQIDMDEYEIPFYYIMTASIIIYDYGITSNSLYAFVRLANNSKIELRA